jgi:predicted O-methyltransferase YrrM
LLDYEDYFDWAEYHLKMAQIRGEIKALIELLSPRKPKRIMEIGTSRGGSLFLFAKLLDPDLIVSIDKPFGDFDGIGFENDELYKSFGRDVRIIRDDSHKDQTLNTVKGILGNDLLDFLFVDGDHTYDGIKKDFEMYYPLVKKGGIIALHDIIKNPADIRCKVYDFWTEIKLMYNCSEIVYDEKQLCCGIGIVEK